MELTGITQQRRSRDEQRRSFFLCSSPFLRCVILLPRYPPFPLLAQPCHLVVTLGDEVLTLPAVLLIQSLALRRVERRVDLRLVQHLQLGDLRVVEIARRGD